MLQQHSNQGHGHHHENVKHQSRVIEDGDHAPLSLSHGRASTGLFGVAALLVQTALTVAFFFTGYDLTSLTVFNSSQAYDFYVAIGVMLFVGFGYLFTFLKSYGIGALGFTMFMGCLGLQWTLLLQGWMRTGDYHLTFHVVSFIRANQGVAAVLVSFGALLGKTSPLQVLFLTLLGGACVTANKVYIIDAFLVKDVGCTYSVHLFGALFGVCASMVCSRGITINEELLSSTYSSDINSLLGTVFLWLFWPCFTAGDLTMGTAQQKLALMNTIFALVGSTVTTYAVSNLLSATKRLTTIPIQMATLSGGVAIGAVCNYQVLPGGAVLIGMGAGALSTFSFTYLHNFLPDTYDTAGVMSLHGIPGVFGAVVSILLPFLKPVELDPSAQALGLGCVCLAAVVSGGITGFILSKCGQPAVAYNDEAYWDVAT